ncbi:MAG: GNAT family N-acetyltransferase [Paracoccaceae bacterium]
MKMLHLATADDRDKLLPLIAAYHAHEGLDTTEAERAAALDVLFSGEVQAALWLIGPRRAPVGYIAVAFGFSIELGGRDAFIDEFFIREAVRGRGMGSQVLELLAPMLRQMGVKALHMEVAQDNERAARLYARAGFRPRQKYFLMTRPL